MPYPSYRHPSPHYRTPGRSVVLLGAGGAPAGNAQLVTDLGGDSVVLAFYDARNNVTTSGTLVDAWDDTRAAVGYGPQLSATGANRPTWDSVNRTISGANGPYLASAASSLFALDTAKSIVFIGAVLSTGTGDMATVSISESGITRILAIAGEGTGGQFIKTVARGSATLVYVTSTVATGATRRLAIASRTATTEAGVEVPNVARTTGATDAAAAGNLTLTLFDYFPAAGGPSGSLARAVLVLNRVATASDVTALKTYATTHHGTTNA